MEWWWVGGEGLQMSLHIFEKKYNYYFSTKQITDNIKIRYDNNINTLYLYFKFIDFRNYLYSIFNGEGRELKDSHYRYNINNSHVACMQNLLLTFKYFLLLN